MTLDAALVFSTLLGAVIVIFRARFLPSRFFSDGAFIQSVAQGHASVTADPSFAAVAGAYRTLGLANHPTEASIIGYAAGVALIWIVRSRFIRYPHTALIIGTPVVVLLEAVYLGYYSKDVFVVPVIAAVLLLPSRKIATLLILAAMILYATTFRGYWLLVAGLYVAFLLLFRAKRHRVTLAVLGSMAALAAIAVTMPILLHVNATYYRESINAGRVGTEDAATIIQPVISSTSTAAAIVNLFAAYAGLIIPIPLLRLGGAYYAALAVLFACIWTDVARSLRTLGRASVCAPNGALAARSLALLVAFLTTQALFEPDYGSALRHLTPLLPLAIAVGAAARDVRTASREPSHRFRARRLTEVGARI